jgi:hypothetical protein
MFNNLFTTSSGKLFSVIILFSLIIIMSGCQKKTEQPTGETKKDTTQVVTPQQPDTTAKTDTTKKYPDLTGTWTGSFQSHNATLKISDQNGENFKASLNIAYREPMQKTISGTIKPETNKVNMRDAVKTRYEASYVADLSKDGKQLSGTAHFKVDGNDVNFTFKKK